MQTTDGGAKVMLIDDEQMDQMMYRRVLKRFGKISSVKSFSTALEALEYLRAPDAEQPNIIFLDINMPKMNGFEFLDIAISEFGAGFADLVVFMLTTSLDPNDKARAESYDVVKSFISKPLTVELLGELETYF